MHIPNENPGQNIHTDILHTRLLVRLNHKSNVKMVDFVQCEIFHQLWVRISTDLLLQFSVRENGQY